ncbi:MAG TPA: trehalase-like domain-containing protein [Trebonia sp.]
MRVLACTRGEIQAEVSYAPRPEYGLIHPVLVPVAGGLAARGGASRLLLSTQASFDLNGATATATVRLAAGQSAVFALGLAVLVGDSPELRGAVARAGAPFLARAAGHDVRADRRDGGGAHHLPAGDRRRRAELGLPLHLGARRQPDHGGPVGGGLPGRGQ